MTKKDKLKEMLDKRNPLDSKREAVTPVDLYTKPQVDKDTKPQRVKNTKPLVVKYTTHLTQKVIKDLKMYALENDLKDYEVMQEAIEKFLKDKK